jgi:hypothetical protein
MQLIDSTAALSPSDNPSHVITLAHAVYSSLTQSYSTADDSGRVTKPKISDASARHLQEAEARVAVLKKIISGQGLVMVFMKL